MHAQGAHGRAVRRLHRPARRFRHLRGILRNPDLGPARLSQKPMGLLNINGFYDPLLAMFDRAVTDGFLRRRTGRWRWPTPGSKACWRRWAYRAEPVSKWLKEENSCSNHPIQFRQRTQKRSEET